MAPVMIKTRSLGKTGIQVSPIGLGTLMFGTGGFPQNLVSPLVIPQKEKNAIVKAALDGGITWFDTYGGRYERSLAASLKEAGKSDNDVVIATKWEPTFKTARNITRTIHKHIEALGGFRIGLYIVHWPTSFSSPEAEMNAMAELVESGKIRSVGVSNFSAERMRRAFNVLHARGIPLAVNQVFYNLVYRKIETNGVLETAKELGVTIMAHSPLMEGLLTGKYHKNPELIKSMGIIRRRMMIKPYFEKSLPLINALKKIAVKYNVTPAQAALNWLINFHGESVVAIPGASNARQADSNAGAMRFRLSQDDMVCLDELSRAFR